MQIEKQTKTSLTSTNCKTDRTEATTQILPASLVSLQIFNATWPKFGLNPSFSTWLRKHSPGGNIAVMYFCLPSTLICSPMTWCWITPQNLVCLHVPLDKLSYHNLGSLCFCYTPTVQWRPDVPKHPPSVYQAESYTMKQRELAVICII